MNQTDRTRRCFTFRIRLLILLTQVVGCSLICGQTSEQLDAVYGALEKIHRSVPLGNDAIVQEVVMDLTSKFGREDASRLICRVARERALDVTQLYIARRVGNSLQPEFSNSVFRALEDNADPLAAGRLLLLLRMAPPEDAKGVALWLSDNRPAEELTRRARQERGARALRVCDIAFNVLQEILATDKSAITGQLLFRSSSIAEREALIAPLRGLSSYPPKPNSPNEVVQETPPKTTDAEQSGGAASIPTSSAPELLALPVNRRTLVWWSLFTVAALALVGLLLWKRRA